MPPAFEGGKVRPFGHNDKIITEFPENFYTTDAFASHTIETKRRFAKTGEPFFIHLAFTSPDYPLHAWPEDIAKYRGQYRMGMVGQLRGASRQVEARVGHREQTGEVGTL